ncbi:hypothetical protein O3G_MSEX005269 [Manduca sexta]|uniref:SCP domain-containing protein n=1 Tax=Manduca sexta TaxID=7130 RepID=A0A922CJ09_MANSE|nr:hypothetical protein O3G_MSEX005269 [Manduca sexta]
MSKFFGSKNNDFEIETLEIHNEYRRDHGVPPLTLNKDISKISQKWAEELAKKDAMAYSLNPMYGESVYCGWSADPNTKIKPRDCVDKWYSEINEFSFGKEPDILNCGHFTQIVWKGTKELGVGSAKSKTGKLYVVANYYPPGNYSGLFVKNVLPPGAMQFRSSFNSSPRGSSNNLSPPSPSRLSSRSSYDGSNASSPSQRSSKNLGELATDLVSKFRSSSISTEKFEEEFLAAHNEYRQNHGVQPLELNKKLCKYAEEWAKTLAKKGKTEPRDQNEYGENIFYAWSSDPNFSVSGRDPVDKWYSEINNHKFGKEPTNLNSGHFSQVIWEDSKELGVGVAKSKEGQVYVVANYSPPGNVIGSFSTKLCLSTQAADHDLILNRIIDIIQRRNFLEREPLILGVPQDPEDLPEAELILPGHTLIRPARGMLKSSVKFPQKDYGNLVYGNLDNLGITYGKSGYRTLYTGFRKANDLLENLLHVMKNTNRKPTIVIIKIDDDETRLQGISLESHLANPDQETEEENDASEILDE